MTQNLEPKLCFGDLFGKLDPEKKVEIIKPKEVKRNKTLDLIVRGYEKGLENYGLYDKAKRKIGISEGEYFGYHIAKSSAPSKIPSDSITDFSLLLGEYENNEYFEWLFTGFYLSALINKSKEQDFKIITNHLTKTISWIGYENVKNIDVNGNVGYGVGWYMEEGKITVNGNAGNLVGNGMKGGEIHLNGDYESLSRNIFGGNIYHKGKLIVRNGRRLI